MFAPQTGFNTSEQLSNAEIKLWTLSVLPGWSSKLLLIVLYDQIKEYSAVRTFGRTGSK